MFRYMLNGMFAARTLRAPDADADAGGGTEDRGDNWTPTDGPPPADADGHKKEGDGDGDGGGLADKLAQEQEEAEKAKAVKAKKPSLKDGEDDPDKEGEDDPDREGEDDPDKDKGDKRKDSRMPISRHKQILEKERTERRELEQRLAKYEEGNKVAVLNDEITAGEADIEKLEEKYAKQITDGDHTAAHQTNREIRKLERVLSDKKVAFAAQAAESNAIERVRYSTVVERLEAAYPTLNPDDDAYDKESTQDVLDLAATYRRRGLTPAESIQKAAKKMLGSETKKQESATETKPRVSEEDVAEAKRAERKREQVEKNLKIKQPASTAKLGSDSDKAGGGIRAADVMKMSEKDFNSLDEETLAKMRGDFIA